VAGDPVFADGSAMHPFNGRVSIGNGLRRFQESSRFKVRNNDRTAFVIEMLFYAQQPTAHGDVTEDPPLVRSDKTYKIKTSFPAAPQQ